MEFTHQKAGTLIIREITQGMLEKYAGAHRKYAPEKVSVIEYSGVVLRAAIEAGMIESPPMTVADVANLKPWQVKWFEQGINTAYMDAVTIPNE